MGVVDTGWDYRLTTSTRTEATIVTRVSMAYNQEVINQQIEINSPDAGPRRVDCYWKDSEGVAEGLLAKHCAIGSNQVVLVGNPYFFAFGGAIQAVGEIQKAMHGRALETVGLVFHGEGFKVLSPGGNWLHRPKACFQNALQEARQMAEGRDRSGTCEGTGSLKDYLAALGLDKIDLLTHILDLAECRLVLEEFKQTGDVQAALRLEALQIL
ncbi:hypothetical protein WJX73_000774 [Symbiochloris irregularis]|uniref:Uncharacterized protein n=1 Tax=Symbiochloris irregularis TaxID=706552 RepID=A0AAW1PN25_9CHLO